MCWTDGFFFPFGGHFVLFILDHAVYTVHVLVPVHPQFLTLMVNITSGFKFTDGRKQERMSVYAILFLAYLLSLTPPPPQSTFMISPGCLCMCLGPSCSFLIVWLFAAGGHLIAILHNFQQTILALCMCTVVRQEHPCTTYCRILTWCILILHHGKICSFC